MKTLTRRSVLATGLAAPFVAHGAEPDFVWHIGHSFPRASATQLHMLEATASIMRKAAGRFSVQSHPGGERGSQIGMLAQVRAGKLDAALLSGQTLAHVAADAILPLMGFSWSGYEQLWSAMDGDFGAFVRSWMQQHLGFTVLQRSWDFGFRHVTTSGKVMRSAPDIVGLRLRTPAESTLIRLFDGLGAIPLTIPLRDLSRALARHVVDAQEGLLQLAQMVHLDRLQSTCALTHHEWDGLWVCVAQKSWDALPANLKDVVASSLNDAALGQRADIAKEVADARSTLEKGGVVFNTVDQDSFRAALRKSGYYEQYRKQVSADGWKALEAAAGHLA